MNPEELIELTTIISTKKFEGYVYAKSKIDLHDKIRKMTFSSYTLLTVEKIVVNYQQNKDDSEIKTWIINCKLRIEKYAKLFEEKHISPEIRNNIFYDGFFIEITSPELESGFYILSHFNYSVKDINNKIYREHILKEYIFKKKEFYPFDEEFKKKIKECYDGKYSFGLLNNGDFYTFASELFETYRRDLNNPHTVENLPLNLN